MEKIFVYEEKKFGRIDSWQALIHEISKSQKNLFNIPQSLKGVNSLYKEH